MFGLGLVCFLFARSPVLFSFFGRLFGTLGELRLLVTSVLSGRWVSGLSWFFEALILASLERRDKGLLRRILSGSVWNGFLLSFVRGEIVPCRFCGGPDGHLFWECFHPPFVHIRESPEFHDLLLRDKSFWPWCLL